SVDHRTDLWSLAIIAFECVTGRRPFQSEALGDLILQICVRPIKLPSTVVSVPVAFDEWYAKATQRDPAMRFQSARDLMTGLRAAAGLRSTGDTREVKGNLQSSADLAPMLAAEQAAAAAAARPSNKPPGRLNATTGGMGADARIPGVSGQIP